MTLFQSPIPYVEPRDDLTIPQFVFSETFEHPTKSADVGKFPCMIEEETGRKVYLSELQYRTDALARAFSALWNIGDGDIVSLYIPNHVDYPTLTWATQKIGGIVAALSASLTSEELAYQLTVAKPSFLVAYVENLPAAIEAANAVKLPHSRIIVLDGHKAPKKLALKTVEDLVNDKTLPPYVEYKFTKPGQAREKIAFLCFSSGTTGKPKAVAISHYNVISDLIQFATLAGQGQNHAPPEERRFRPGDVVSGVLPFSHIYGLVVNLHAMFYVSMTVVVSAKFNYERFLENIDTYGITHLLIVPPQALLLVKHPATKKYNLSTLRVIVAAAAPVSAELTTQLVEAFPKLHIGQGYGMTETTAAVTVYPITQKVGTLGSAGQLVPGITAKVVKPDGSLAGVGEPGELLLKGPQIALGYYHNEQATNETFIDGWLKTGDEVLFAENGDMFVTDRIKELIKVKGNQVAPSELEGHLLDHPDVADVAVIGIPDDFAGEAPLAYVVLKPAVAAEVAKTPGLVEEVKDRLQKHVSATKSKYKWLTGGVIFIEAIPKSPSGKILRRVLRDQSKALRAQAQKPSAKL
ncbi:phenylacetyl-CoA ligase [Trametes versicolor FP-101664 SS1]|uniref:phenylacetyl-CoA ligase n=1 Tax=Trametes versicolor (strain FP-101664) TaxID=717944 RepID=UPI0004623E11|nr:phenylacetyl-CoA ligase [Trametes versicolor FP-101664 SS1]EIW53297.1 phenylacetyl-CoA ligase [Trametes versicolor FP-101664 SS1]